MNTIHIHLPERTFATDLQLHHLERYIMDTASCGWVDIYESVLVLDWIGTIPSPLPLPLLHDSLCAHLTLVKLLPEPKTLLKSPELTSLRMPF
jgi:hypothetical protein